MELYLIFAIMSAITAGLYNFRIKIIVERNYNTHLVTLYDYIFSMIISLGVLLVFTDITSFSRNEVLMIFIFALINTTFIFFAVFGRVEALKNIDSVIFFPLYKTIGPLIITAIGFFVFKETLSNKEILGVITAICVPLLLITKTENRVQKSLFLGVVFVVIVSLLTSISSSATKELRVENLNPELFVFFAMSIGTLYSFLSCRVRGSKITKTHSTKELLKFGFFASFLHLGTLYPFVYALGGKLAVVFSINSFSILIPIILSIIFYGEHFSLKKALVIGLSVISILLFI